MLRSSFIGFVALSFLLTACGEEGTDVERVMPSASQRQTPLVKDKSGTLYLMSCIRDNGPQIHSLKGTTEGKQLLSSCAVSNQQGSDINRPRLVGSESDGSGQRTSFFNFGLVYQLDRFWNKRNNNALCRFFLNTSCSDSTWYTSIFLFDDRIEASDDCYSLCRYSWNRRRCLNRCWYDWRR